MTTTVREVPLRRTESLALFHDLDDFDPLVAEVRQEGARISKLLGRRRIWMLNSTATGGGVAEMMPGLCVLLADVGVDTRWLVLEPTEPQFFRLTKALHNMLHGKEGNVDLEAGRRIYERISAEAVEGLRPVQPCDLLVVHDPQPAGIGPLLRHGACPILLWRCHVGVSKQNEHTERAWDFLRPYLEAYESMLFSWLSYAPDEWLARSAELSPGIDPLAHKNRTLRPYKLVGVLRAAGLIDGPPVPEWARFRAPVRRWTGIGWEATPIADLLHTPAIVQISRFDRLKGFDLLLPAFERLLELAPAEAPRTRAKTERMLSEVGRARLILAGPEPAGVADDPEAMEVLEELCAAHARLPPEVQSRVHILRLPMEDVKENALIVNALQRLAAAVVQSSVEEGFGLTVSEALWKGTPVVASNVGGIATQIRSGTDGILVDDPADSEALGRGLLRVFAAPMEVELMARSGRARVRDHFTILSQVRSWLRAFSRALAADNPGASPGG